IFIVIILRFSEIMLKAKNISKPLKAHRTISSAMIKRRVIPQLIGNRNHRLDFLIAIRRTGESICQRWNSGQDTAHSVNGLSAVRKSIGKNKAFLRQTVHERSVRNKILNISVLVKSSRIFSSERFHDENNNIRAFFYASVVGFVRMNILFNKLLLHKIHQTEIITVDGTDERKSTVEHHISLSGILHMFIGIHHIDRARAVPEFATDSPYSQRGHSAEGNNGKKEIRNEFFWFFKLDIYFSVQPDPQSHENEKPDQHKRMLHHGNAENLKQIRFVLCHMHCRNRKTGLTEFEVNEIPKV